MPDLVPFALAVLGLLATPGPTNTLMAAAGAQRGVKASLPLLAGEVGGYLIAITVWIELIGAASASQPLVPVFAKLVAAAFLLWSAIKLWRQSGQGAMAQNGITVGRVFLTTLLNPKGLIFAFAIFPQVPLLERIPYLALFAALVVGTAIVWIGFGTAAARSAARLFTTTRIDQVTSVALALFALGLAVQTLQGIGH